MGEWECECDREGEGECESGGWASYDTDREETRNILVQEASQMKHVPYSAVQYSALHTCGAVQSLCHNLPTTEQLDTKYEN